MNHTVIWVLFYILMHHTFGMSSPSPPPPPHNIKATDSVQNYKTKFKTLLFRKNFTWLYMDHKHMSTDYSLKRLWTL